MSGNRPELRVGCFGSLAVEKVKGRIENIGGGWSPLYGVVDFSWR
jgi:hypothetical protein